MVRIGCAYFDFYGLTFMGVEVRFGKGKRHEKMPINKTLT